MPFLGKVPSQIVDSDVDIDGGTIDGATIGSITAGAGTFTNLSATGTITFPDDGISGDDINGGTISNFTSTGIDDNATSTAVTLDAGGNVSTTNRLRIGTGSIDTRITLNNEGTEQTNSSNFIRGVSGQLIYNSASSVHKWEIAGSEKMRIDSSGRVGIGATSPARILHVENDGQADLLLRDTSSYSVGTGPAVIFQGKESGGTNTQFGAIYGVSNGSNSGELTFETRNSGSSAERMRITSSGNVLVATSSGISSSAGKLQIVGGSSTANGMGIKAAASGTAYLAGFYNTSAGVVGFISTNGSSTTYATSSDYRLKENVVDLDNGIDRLKQIPVHRFNFIADPDKTVDGFIAHEVQDVIPEAITGTKDGMTTEEYEVSPAVLDEEGNVVTEAVMGTREVPEYQGIDQSKLVPLLTAALQEAVAKIEDLESRLSALEAN